MLNFYNSKHYFYNYTCHYNICLIEISDILINIALTFYLETIKNSFFSDPNDPKLVYFRKFRIKFVI